MTKNQYLNDGSERFRGSMSARIWTIYMAFCFLLAGCQTNQVLPTPSQTNLLSTLTMRSPISTVVSSATMTIDSTITLSPSSIPTSTELLPTATLTPPTNSHLTFKCYPILDSIPPGASITGLIILKDNTGSNTNDTTLFDTASGKVTSLGEDNEVLSFFSMSPDRQRIAFDAFEKAPRKENLVVFTANGKRSEVIPWKNGWIGLISWAGDHRLIINSGADSVGSTGQKPPTFLVLNLTNGLQQVLKPNYPNIYDFPPVGSNVTIYDPTLRRVVYLKKDPIKEAVTVLWDLQNHKVLAEFDTTDPATWSPDGSQFIISAPTDQDKSELMIVSRDGKQTQQVTLLNNYFPTYSDVVYYSYEWSPDGRFVAFLYNGNYQPFANAITHLAILDISTGQVTDTCIQGNNSDEITSPLIWSPDSRQVLLSSHVGDRPLDYLYQILVVDVAQGFAARINEITAKKDRFPEGWLKSP